MRRLRRTETLRKAVRETYLRPENLIAPLFARPGRGIRRPIRSMPGQFQLSPDEIGKEVRRLAKLGVGGVMLFGIPSRKDERGSEAWAPDGISQVAIRAAKAAAPDLPVFADLCLCEYTSHGHCGVIRRLGRSWEVDNDETLELLAQIAVAHAEAGADFTAPSGMMDGAVAAIREALDKSGFPNTGILAYAAKFASSFYGPFREAAESPPQFGDRKSYQMDPANLREAMREIAEDLKQGADLVMVKPGLPYLDVLREARRKFDAPLAAYQVSGEYAMLKAAAQNGWLEERAAVLETLLAFKRAGANYILSYYTSAAAEWLR